MVRHLQKLFPQIVKTYRPHHANRCLPQFDNVRASPYHKADQLHTPQQQMKHVQGIPQSQFLGNLRGRS